MGIDRARIILLAIAAMSAVAGVAVTEEGFWPFNQPPLPRIQRAYDFAPDSAWFDQLRLASVRIRSSGLPADVAAAGCLVGKDGLVLTCRHVVTAVLELNRALPEELARDGFIANHDESEIPCPGVVVEILKSIEPVTDEVNGPLAREVSPADATRASKTQRSEVIALHGGAEHWLYRYDCYDDVRLVFLPESFASADPHAATSIRVLDAALLRVYRDGKKIAPDHWLQPGKGSWWRGSFVGVFGNPHSSKRHQSIAESDFMRTMALPLRLRLIDAMIPVCAECEAGDPKNLIAGFKSDLEGERGMLSEDLASLRSKTAIDRLQTTHAIIREKLAPTPAKLAGYDHAAKVLQDGFAAYSLYAKRDFWCQVLEDSIARVQPSYLIRRERLMTKGDLLRMKERLYSFRSRATSLPCYWLLEEPARRSLSEALLAAELERAREDLGKDDPLVVGVLDGHACAELSKAVGMDDSLIKWILSIGSELDEKAAADLCRDFEKANESIASSFEAAFGDAYPPDANGAPRFSYGSLEGWSKGRECVSWETTFASFLESVEKDGGLVPARWLAAADKENGSTTHSFFSTADVLPGNSGGAAVDREGRLRGVMTNGGFNADLFDATTTRSMGLDIDVILLVLRRVYGAEELAREITGPW